MKFDFSRNYFELFDLEVKFQLDLASLAAGYQKQQSQFHPDRYINSDNQEKRIAMQATTFINEAYKVLSDEHARARYMLELKGVPFDSEQDTTHDMEFLMSQMSLREEIDEADKQEDPLVYLDELSKHSSEQKQNLINKFQECYQEGAWDDAKEIVIKLQFFTRLHHQLNSKQEALEDELL